MKLARTSKQKRRNTAVGKALDLLKGDARNQGKTVAIDWQYQGHGGKRVVTVDGAIAFKQDSSEVFGSFQNIFSNLKLE